MRHQIGADRVLHPGAQSADDQSPYQHGKADARPGDEIADASERGAKAKDQRPAKTLRDQSCRHLEGGHCAHIERAEQTNRGVIEGKLGLP